MIPPRLRLLALGPLGEQAALVPWLGEELRARFGFADLERDALPLLDAWLVPEREQYASNAVVDALVQLDADDPAAPRARWTLALTGADLFAPGRAFVFGEATLGGGWALVSFARFHDPDAPELLGRRLLTEAVHELGHLAGLDHCSRPDCAMFPSPGLAATDRKGSELCPRCRAALRTP